MGKEGKMKTAEEMINHVITNKLGTGFTKFWTIKHFRLIANSLGEEEEVLTCFVGLHNYISAMKHNGNFAFAVTNKRIIIAQKKLIGESFQTVLLENLNDITFKSDILFGLITFDTIKEVFSVKVDKKQAENINDIIHKILIEVKDKKLGNGDVKTSIESELRQFKKLYDDNVITQEEFELKKKELLKL